MGCRLSGICRLLQPACDGIGDREMDFDLLNQIRTKMPRHIKLCISSGLIVGLLTHFYMLTHKLPNWDDINAINMYGSGDYLGRWFLKYIHPIGTQYSIPAIHGFLMIFILVLAACLVLEILNLKSTTAAVLVPALMVTFPSVACTMTFMFMAHTSAIGIFMICLAVYLLRRYRFGWLPCTVLFICSLGIYQSYISIGIALMLMGMMVDLLDGKECKEVFKNGVLYVIVLGIAVVIYMQLCHVIYPAIDNETYGGIGNMGNIAIAEMPVLIARCYKRFMEYFIWKPFAFMSQTMQICNILTCVLACILGVYLIVAKKLYRKIWETALFCLAAFFMPLAVAFVYFMAPEADYSMLMLYAYVLIYITVVMLWEQAVGFWNNQKENKILNRAAGICSVMVIAVMLVSCYSNYLITNKAYFRMELAKDRVTAYLNRIIANIEAVDGYVTGDEVAILGNFYYKDNPSPVEMDLLDSEPLREMSGVALENGLITPAVRDNFIRYYVGFNITEMSDTRKNELMETQQYQDMPLYPETGSIAKIEDVWVVKLSEE